MVGFSDLLWDPQASKKTARSSTPSPAEKASQVPQNQKPLPQKHLNALAVSDKLAHVLPCTASSHATGNFFDLQPLIRQYPHDSADWQVRGIDFHANFTINFCAPLLLPVEFDDQGKEVAPSHDEPVKPAIESLDQSVKNLETEAPSQSYSANVSAVMRLADGSLKSIGKASSTPYFRGRNLLLEYHDGSPCTNPDGSTTGLRMSTLISLKCGHDLAASHAHVSFLGSPDNCTYFFEARTLHACPASNKEESVAPVPIFLVISLVAIGVYAMATMFLKPITAFFNSHLHNHGTVTLDFPPQKSYDDTSNILPIADGGKGGASSTTTTQLISSNFSFPFPLSFLNPILYRIRRNHYVPGRSSALSPDGETITVFEAISNSLPTASGTSTSGSRTHTRTNSGSNAGKFYSNARYGGEKGLGDAEPLHHARSLSTDIRLSGEGRLTSRSNSNSSITGDSDGFVELSGNGPLPTASASRKGDLQAGKMAAAGVDSSNIV